MFDNVIAAPRPFPGNIIPQDRIHPVARKLLAYFPLNQTNARAANFVNNEGRLVDADQVTYRLDFSEHAKSNWFFRHSFSTEHGYDPYPIPNMGINTDTKVQQGVLGNTRVYGANKVNDVRFGLSRLENAHISPRANNVTLPPGHSTWQAHSYTLALFWEATRNIRIGLEASKTVTEDRIAIFGDSKRDTAFMLQLELKF